MPKGKFNFKCKPGVYKMINTISGNFYIGSSKNVSIRIKTHKYLLRHGYKSNIRIKSDLERYGLESFIFEAIEYCDENIMKDREQYYFDQLKPNYNVWNNVFNAIGRLYTPEQLQNCFPKREIKDKDAFKKKLKESWLIRKNRPDGIATLNMLDRTGKLHSPETIAKMKANRKGKPKSQEFKEKLRQARLGTKWDPINKTWIKN